MAERHCTCAHCGAAFVTRWNIKYCSLACSNAAKPRRQNQVCRHCGKEFHPKSTTRTSYCSRDCYFAAKSAAKAARAAEVKPTFSKVVLSECRVCGKAFYAPRARWYCGAGCEAEKERRRAYESNKAKKQKPPQACKHCGGSFVPAYGSKLRVFCSDKCRKGWVKRETRRKYGTTHRKRARRFGVEYEPVNMLRVFERDGWRCQICGKATPKTKRGTNHPSAPELDHRVPLSLGGGHTYKNTQCACRACNGAKGNSNERGQMPLFG